MRIGAKPNGKPEGKRSKYAKMPEIWHFSLCMSLRAEGLSAIPVAIA